MKLAILLCAVLFFSALGSMAQEPPRPAPSAEQLAGAIWVEGRVVLPAGVPADEKLEVVARATGLPRFREFSAVPDATGHFRVAFAKNARRGKLSVRGRYLYVDPEVSWRASAPQAEIVLAPRVGGFLRGRLVMPKGKLPSIDDDIRAWHLQLDGTPLTAGQRALRLDPELVPRSTVVAGKDSTEDRHGAEPGVPSGVDMTFECGGLQTDYTWSLTVVAGAFVPLVVEGLNFEAGQAQDRQWTLQRGATLRGTVVDEYGVPVPGARIDVDCRGAPLSPSPRDVQAGLASGVDGAFVLRGLAPGNVRIWAVKDGWIQVDTEIEALQDGEVRAGVKVALLRGVVLTARVLDPGGEPAAGARVRVAQSAPGRAPLVREIVTLDDGTFTCSGLGDAHVDITVTRESILNDGAAPGDAPAEPQRRKLRASLLDVDPTTKDLVLTLVEGLSIRGRVHDDLGRRVLRYTAGARRADDPNPHAVPRSVDVKGGSGVFEIEDLEPGAWDVFTIGRGFVYEPARRVVVPCTGDPLVFVVRRPAVVSGVVLEAARTPASRVLVEIEWERPALFGAKPATERASVTCAPDGKFEITEVFPGRVRVSATNADGRKSAPVELELASGAVRSGVEVVLPP